MTGLPKNKVKRMAVKANQQAVLFLQDEDFDMEIDLQPNAVLNHFTIYQDAKKKPTNIIKVKQAKGSQYRSFVLSLSGEVSHAIEVEQKGQKAQTVLNGLFIADQKEQSRHQTLVKHLAPNGTSDQFYKGIIDDQAQAAFLGKIIVGKNGAKTNSYQVNKNLLLSKTATVDSRPQLEIETDEVKCTHGSTTGHLDEEALFYLRSRGLSQIEAKKMLVESFAQDFLSKIADEGVRHQFAALVQTKLCS